MHKPLLLFLIVAFLFTSCKKSQNNPTPTNNIQLQLISGNNQTTQIGYALSDSIVVKVTNNAGTPLNNYNVQFIGSGCNEDLITNVYTKSDGTAKYSWAMASNQGQQLLNIVAVNLGKRVDSINVSATALSYDGFANKSACTPNQGNQPESIQQLSTGRLLACFSGKTSIRYSDDNGASWNPLKGFGANHSVDLIVTTPQDEIFAATLNEGLFIQKMQEIHGPIFRHQPSINKILLLI